MNCKQCGEELVGKREGAIYCNHNCQQKYFKRKKWMIDRIKKLVREKEFNETFIEELKNKEKDKELKQKKRFNQLKEIIDRSKKKIGNLEKLLQLKVVQFRSRLLQYLDQKEPSPKFNYSLLINGSRLEQLEVMDDFRGRFRSILNQSKNKFNSLSNEHNLLNLQQLFPITSESNPRISKLENELGEINKELDDLNDIDLDRLPIKPSQIKKSRPKAVSPARAYSGKEILNMSFDGVQLKGELGKFLGKLQREKCAIALTGDSGAGKSTFSYQVAKAFLEKNQSVAYFSLESGFTESTQRLISEYGIDQYKFKAFDEGGLKDVRIEASNFDCVVIDSYSKISQKAIDFEELRQDFPNTYFVVIFQKTTDGKIRGGSSIIFNSTATIDIKVTKEGHRIATMQKSRYDTENFVYSISRDEVLKSDKRPVVWREIEENWRSINN